MKHDYAFVVCIISLFSLYYGLNIFIAFWFPNHPRQKNFCLLHNVFQQEFSDPRDADDARYYLDGRDIDGRRIIVEFAKGVSISYMYFLEFSPVNLLSLTND